MISYDLGFRISSLHKELEELRTEIVELKGQSNDEMWDNSDMMRNWRVSQRTLATWRAEGLIDYIQVGNKIWYTKENRETFLSKNTVKH